MDTSFEDEEKEGLIRTIDNLKIFKHLQLLGYTIPTMQFTTTNDDMLSDQEDLGFNVISLITDGQCNLDCVQPSKYDVISMSDDDGYMVMEIKIFHPAIVQYLKSLPDKKHYSGGFGDIFKVLLSTEYGWYSDYTVYEAIVDENDEGIIIVCSDFLFFNSYFVEKLVELLNYCKMENDNKIKGGDETDANNVTR